MSEAAVVPDPPYGSRSVVPCSRCAEPAVATHTKYRACEAHLDGFNEGPQPGDGAYAWLDQDGVWQPAPQWWRAEQITFARSHPPEAAALMYQRFDAGRLWEGKDWSVFCMHHHEAGCRHGRTDTPAELIVLWPAREVPWPEDGQGSFAVAMCRPCWSEYRAWEPRSRLPRVPGRRPRVALERRDGRWLPPPV